jgi:hypothetical protein
MAAATACEALDFGHWVQSSTQVSIHHLIARTTSFHLQGLAYGIALLKSQPEETFHDLTPSVAMRHRLTATQTSAGCSAMRCVKMAAHTCGHTRCAD